MSRAYPFIPLRKALIVSGWAWAGAWAQVDIRFSGDLPATGGAGYKVLRAKACNETPRGHNLKGWRFKTPSFGGWSAYYAPTYKTGAGPFEYTQDVAPYDQTLPAGGCTSTPAEYHAAIPAGQDGTPYDSQVLLKAGSCVEPSAIPVSPPVRCGEIADLLRGPAYHDPRHCILDTLGTGGASASGSLTADHRGQTQIQAAMPTEYWQVYGWPMRWDPRVLGGPLYMMALAMGQEYLGMNRQWLQVIAGKESNFAYVAKDFPERGSISEWANGNVDSDGSWILWQVLTPYFANLIHAYPDFFPAHACAAAFPGPIPAETCVGGWEKAIAHYVRTPGLSPSKTGANSPQLANAVLSVSLAYFWIYDALWQATDLCYADAVLHGKDRRVALAGIMPLYADGIYSGNAAHADPDLRHNPDAYHAIKAGPSPEYRDNVFSMLEEFHKVNDASEACGGPYPVYDAAIPWDDVQRFYFGGSAAPGTPEAQGDGGLLLHREVSLAERRALLGDLRCAFDQLKGKAPSTAGMEAISFRYDWLTVLRSVRAYLPFERRLPMQTEFNTWVRDRSKGPRTCAGAPRDTAHPHLAITAPAQGATVPAGFTVEFTVHDGSAVLLAEGTLDRTWMRWSPADTLGSGRYAFRVPCADLPAATQGPLALWIRAGDLCGNHTYQRFDFNLAPGACLPPGPGLLKPDPPRPLAGPVVPPDPGRPADPAKPAKPIDPPDPVRLPDPAKPDPAAKSGPLQLHLVYANGSPDRPAPGAAIIRILTPGPVDYRLRIYSNLGERVADLSGSLKASDLAGLPRAQDTSGLRYRADLAWDGRTREGARAGTGAYILHAVLTPSPGMPGAARVHRQKLVFGLLRD